MSHIHIDPGQHDFTASAFVFLTNGDKPKILLHMHKKLKQWLQFGGHIELHENPWQAVEHELLEESGYDMAQLQLIEVVKSPNLSDGLSVSHPIPFSVNTHPFSDDHSHIDLAYGFTTSQKPKHKIGEDESKLMRKFSRSELLAIPAGQIPENVRELGLFVFDNLLAQKP